MYGRRGDPRTCIVCEQSYQGRLDSSTHSIEPHDDFCPGLEEQGFHMIRINVDEEIHIQQLNVSNNYQANH